MVLCLYVHLLANLEFSIPYHSLYMCYMLFQELAALREKQAMIQTSGYIEQTDFQAQLDSNLEEAIDELREKSEKEIEDYKASVENAYRDKVSHIIFLYTGNIIYV